MRAAALALMALVAACGEREPEPAAVSTATPAEGEATVPQTADSRPALALDMDGLRLVDPASGKATALAFGTSRKTVDEAVEKATGLAANLSQMGECPAGPMDFSAYGALTLNFVEGKFAGWSIGEGEPKLTTIDGIGVGSTRASVEASRTLEILKGSTLGEEFSIGSGEQVVSGIFDGAGPEAKIEVIWAGIACNFR